MDFEKRFLDAKKHVYKLLNGLDKNLLYHNKHHTIFMLKEAENFKEKFSDKNFFLLKTAVLFHDTGFLKKYYNHEFESVNFFEEYLKKSSFFYSNKEIDIIKKLILITKLDLKVKPKTFLEKTIRDLDLYYFGYTKKYFYKKILDLKKEVYFFKVKNLYEYSKSEKCWVKNSIFFIKKHSFYTDTAKKLYGKNKFENLKFLERKLESL